MSQPDPAQPPAVQADVAALAGAIERATVDLAVGEEPSNFVVALDDGAPA